MPQVLVLGLQLFGRPYTEASKHGMTADAAAAHCRMHRKVLGHPPRLRKPDATLAIAAREQAAGGRSAASAHQQVEAAPGW